MFKKILIALIAMIPMALAAQTVKIGVIDVNQLMTADPATAEAQKQLQAAQDKFAADLQKIQDEFQKSVEEYNKLKADPATPEAILKRHETTLGEMQQKIQLQAQTYDQDLQKQSAQLLAPIQQKILDAAKAIGQENGLTIIIPVEAAVYKSADVVDVNPLVKAKLGFK